jgi:hypothetical protein
MMMHKNKRTNKSKRGIFLGRYKSIGKVHEDSNCTDQMSCIGWRGCQRGRGEKPEEEIRLLEWRNHRERKGK